LKTLDGIKDWEYEVQVEPAGENSALKDLIDKRNNLKEELGNLEDTISATQSFINNNFSYSDEVEHHKIRLETIGLFDQINLDYNICPLCNNELQTEIPSVSSIKDSLNVLNRSLESTVREKPRLSEYLNKLNEQQENIKAEVVKTEQR